ncbi:dipicolinic acid synthetase, A subunit [Caldalkalibacillus thermarum TA2.A1]|uniref:Dipicolinic acid synthetase subunit A n=1 Tax=Caldalkalibacillus thermarum (strain TA2.A1) TaxID=986075 RepID=F5L9T2_CALTT|nr:dipicolinic acid synthetase subunit A [Caldalkalibacillus thermarum]EGL81931.1 dipicolinic acid synthetase, A subunit [Caldalkalibacillus thermarum TA2.A1]QZT32972.1 dipicolinic acid synthetase subunit A [Caldalkalibacillus thermarum TA2.A1]
MLTGCHVAFIGGDARQIEVIKKCSELDATILLIGFNRLESQYPGATKVNPSPEIFEEVDALILPVVGTQDDGIVESIFSDQIIILKDEWLEALPDHCVIYTGMSTPYLEQLASKYNLKLVQLLERDDVAIYNSIPTVEGALMMAIQNTDITLHGSHCVVLGLGRVGMTLARTLHAIGAKVFVGARKKEHLARIYEMSLTPFHLQEIKQYVQHCDILFNTIPSKVVPAEVIVHLPSHALIIDLASNPGGVDFRFAEKRGIKALLAPGLPGIVAPKTAGRILANVVTQLLIEERQARGENDGFKR